MQKYNIHRKRQFRTEAVLYTSRRSNRRRLGVAWTRNVNHKVLAVHAEMHRWSEPQKSQECLPDEIEELIQ